MKLAQSFAEKNLSHDRSQLAGLLNSSAAAGQADPTRSPAAAATPQPGSAPQVRALEKHLAPAIADSYNNLGVIAATSAQYPRALSDFDQAAEWNPALPGLDLNRGRAAFMASQFSQAIAPLSRYVQSHPQDSGVRGALAMSQFMTHDYSACVRTLQGVEAQLAAIPQMAYIFAESLVQTGRTSQGMRRLEALAAAHPEIGDVHRALGEAFAAEHNLPRARTELRAALALNASDAQAHYDLGKLALDSGHAATALPDLEASVRLSPAAPAYHRQLALAYAALARPADAQKESALAGKLAQGAQAETSAAAPASDPR